MLGNSDILHYLSSGNINIEPFNSDNLHDCYYVVRNNSVLMSYSNNELDAREENDIVEVEIPDNGLEIHPNKIYMLNTMEKIGSDSFIPSLNLEGGVLGISFLSPRIFCEVNTFNFVMVPFYAVQPIKIYANMEIGKLFFHKIVN